MRIKIAKDFSYTPGPRKRREGDYSGETFREEVLVPALREAIKKNEKLVVDLDGSAGYGHSFLEESFGGMVRHRDFSEDQVLSNIEIISTEEPYLKPRIIGFIREAAVRT